MMLFYYDAMLPYGILAVDRLNTVFFQVLAVYACMRMWAMKFDLKCKLRVIQSLNSVV